MSIRQTLIVQAVPLATAHRKKTTMRSLSLRTVLVVCLQQVTIVWCQRRCKGGILQAKYAVTKGD